MSRATKTLSPVELRALVRDAIPAESYEYGSEAPLHQFFVPKSHARALHLNTALVIGSRGAGKSFWWGALQSPEHRALVEKFAPDTRIKRATIVRAGFGKRSDVERYPTRDVLASLLSDGQDARRIWKAVMIWAVADNNSRPDMNTWRERVAWAAGNPEVADRLLQDRDQALESADEDLLVVFDALDWTSNDWTVVFKLVEGLLQIALEFRAYRRLRAKVFLRTDQFDDQRIARFPDASKLVASRVHLDWLTIELYALLWQLLAFHPAKGGDFRQMVFDKVVSQDKSAEVLKQPEQWQLPARVHFDVNVQEKLFHALTGPFMGETSRKGFPYKWLPAHLSDARGEVTPRSFLVALRTAAETSIAEHIEWAYALHPQGLQAGVREASRIRVEEISEHRWVPSVMRALREHVLVPFTFEEVASAWDAAGALAGLSDLQQAQVETNSTSGEPWLLPPHLAGGAEGTSEDLATLGVFRKMRDGRIDVPDVYRLGFGLRRKGGVRPAVGSS